MMQHQQSGIALVGVLGVVLALALISLAGLERSRGQAWLGVSSFERERAMQAAQATLRLAEQSAAGYAQPVLSPVPAMDAASWRERLETSGGTIAPFVNTAIDQRPSRLIVEQLRSSDAANCEDASCGYRITALGYGKDASVSVVLQSVIVSGDESRIERELR